MLFSIVIFRQILIFSENRHCHVYLRSISNQNREQIYNIFLQLLQKALENSM